ncbi:MULTISPECIES: inositol monophosphatase family protein [Spirulina sp. CCY15215]|uniref:3'(2'),5'-bisphosphate nucleotidase CysQ family protein n=1 Tax=Spirulina sp. CCY15215 TaxID=2767591 RepID=UPI00194E07AA|nr:inositol monophosphatase family protein [Spirulina major]
MIENRLDEIGAIARQVAWGTADILQAYYRGNTDLDIKDKKGDPVTKADLAANYYILEHLQKELAGEDFGYLSEENFNVEKAEPIAKDWVWIIDPLDGTRDFIEKTGEYAVHIALAYQGRPQLAVVVVPETDKLYFAIKGQGTKVETRSGEVKEIRASDRHKIEDLNLVASRSHRNLRLNKMLERIPFKERFAVGSVGCKVSTILEQKTDVYISLSGKSAPKDWDFAAPELILTEAGGNFTSFEGKDLLYNQGDVNQWGGLMASNGNCHQELYTMAGKILAEIDRELAEEV